MATLRTILLSLLLACAAQGQTLKSLMYNTTNGLVTYTNTNTLTFAASNTYNIAAFSHPYSGATLEIVATDENPNAGYDAPSGSIGVGAGQFWIKHGADSGAWLRPLLVESATGGVPLFGGTWLTNTNVTNFRTAIGLGAGDTVTFGDIFGTSFEANDGSNAVSFQQNGIQFVGTAAATTRTNLSLGATWLTNTNVTNFRTAIELGQTNSPQFANLFLTNSSAGSLTNYILSLASPTTGFTGVGGPVGAVNFRANGSVMWSASDTSGFSFEGATVTQPLTLRYGGGSFGAIAFSGIAADTGAAVSRTNLGLPLAALTNNSNVTMMRALSGSTNTNEPYSGSISVVGTNNTNTLVFSNGILQSVQ